MSVTFSGVTGFFSLQLKATLHHGYFSRFLSCANGTKSRNTSHLKQDPMLDKGHIENLLFRSTLGMPQHN